MSRDQDAPKNIVKRGEVYYGRITVKGKVVQQSLGTSDPDEASRRVAKWRKEVRADLADGIGPQTLHEALINFDDRHAHRKIEASTRRRYCVSAGHLLRIMGGDTKLSKIDRTILSAFEHARGKEGVSNPTIRRDLAFLSSVFEIAGDAGWEGVNPMHKFMRRAKRNGLTENPPRDRYLSHEEEASLISIVDKIATFEHRKLMTRAFITLSIDTGLRHEEMLSLQWANVDLQRKELYVPKEDAKSGIGRRVPLLPRSLELLRTFKRNPRGTHVLHQKDGRRFVSNAMWRPVKNAARLAGIPNLTVHDLRRTCGCRLLQDWGFPIGHVSKWLGHATISVTERHYAFLRVDDLHNAVTKHIEAGYAISNNPPNYDVVSNRQLVDGAAIISVSHDMKEV